VQIAASVDRRVLLLGELLVNRRQHRPLTLGAVHILVHGLLGLGQCDFVAPYHRGVARLARGRERDRQRVQPRLVGLRAGVILRDLRAGRVAEGDLVAELEAVGGDGPRVLALVTAQ